MNQSNIRKKILWITETAVMLALLVSVQYVTSFIPKPVQQFVTGSCVNAILAVTVLMVGFWSGAVVAVVSPFLAFLFQIGPAFIQLLPGIALGNLALVVLLHVVADHQAKNLGRQAAALVLAALGKFATLYLVMVKLLVPVLVSGGVIPPKASALLSAQFSWPQLVTALIGGAVALAVFPLLRRAVKK